jgi:hypothetical protein
LAPKRLVQRSPKGEDRDFMAQRKREGMTAQKETEGMEGKFRRSGPQGLLIFVAEWQDVQIRTRIA